MELPAQGLHVRDELFEALDLHLGPREAVENHAIAVFRVEQAPKQETDDLAVTDHATGVLDPTGGG